MANQWQIAGQSTTNTWPFNARAMDVQEPNKRPLHCQSMVIRWPLAGHQWQLHSHAMAIQWPRAYP
eukprot:367008-Lingulodinium_polyedra.AAC.1